MYALAPDIQRLFDAGAGALAVATTMRTWGSAPLPVGSAMVVGADGAFAGAVSGGCVEAAVIAAGLDMLAVEGAARRLAFDVGDETAWSVGLACGGRLEVWLERWTPAAWQPVAAALTTSDSATLVRIVGGPPEAIGGRYLEAQLIATARGDPPPRHGETMALVDLLGRGAEVFAVTLAPPPHVLLVGAGAIAVALAALAKSVGRRVTIVDPRRTFAAPDRFPSVDALVHAWPAEALADLAIDARSAIVVLSHDPKIDDPALEAALGSPAGYIGALGGRSSQIARRERLLARGWTAGDIARIHGPVGLAIGARTPEEIAVAIIAEIIACGSLPAPATAPRSTAALQ